MPGGLQPGTGQSEKIAEESLEVDDVTHGDVDKAIPDSEGKKRIRLHVSYERSQKNRREAIKKHGTICAVCNFNFDETYGKDYADGYIKIHHVKPLSEYEGEVDPETDLVPLCANCHAMAHRRRATVTSIEELKELIEKARAEQLTAKDVSGGTFTISNHGVSGSLLAAPIIINQPQSAILGVGKLEKRVVVREIGGVDTIQIRPMAYVSLTIDHRVVDGHQTNAWRTRFVEVLESWPAE